MKVQAILFRAVCLPLLAQLALLMPTPAKATPTCTVSPSGTPTASFNTVDTLSSSATDTTASLSATCTNTGGNDKNTVVTICLSLPAGNGTISNRTLVSGGNSMNYNLYTDSGRTAIWGTTGTQQLSMSLTTPNSNNGSATANATVYLRAPGSQSTLVAGSYSSSMQSTGRFLTGSGQTCVGNNSTTNTISATPLVTVGATVANNCLSIAKPAPLAFGSVLGVIKTNVDASTSIAVQCTNNAPFKLGLNAGLGAGATTSVRKLTRTAVPASTVNYMVYRDAARSLNWGNDTTTGTDTVTSGGTGSQQSFTIYGRVPAQTTPRAGTYSDTVTATLAF